MNSNEKKKIAFGDFQTPDDLAELICLRLKEMKISAVSIVEPTCGVGAFVIACMKHLSPDYIFGFEINPSYLSILKSRIKCFQNTNALIKLERADFFETDWKSKVDDITGELLVIGNFPWVTNSTQAVIGSDNIPLKANFQKHRGLDAITGKANFDISEWMLVEVLKWFNGRAGNIAMLVKTAVARKVLSHAQRNGIHVTEATMIKIDAKKYFNASVDACLLIIRLNESSVYNYDYTVFETLDDLTGHRVGHRNGMTISNLDDFESYSYLLGNSENKWRSGIKHDLSAVMEFTLVDGKLVNGLGEIVMIEMDLLFPLLKGSDIGSGKGWREKYVLVPQRNVGQETSSIASLYPKTWEYLNNHSEQLDSRGSIIYKKNPRFSIFGVGEYSFKEWKIAICSLYKKLSFQLIGPIEDKPVMFDDTVYFISFSSFSEADAALEFLNSASVRHFFESLIFWDEKRPIKTSILNQLNWASHNSPIETKDQCTEL